MDIEDVIGNKENNVQDYFNNLVSTSDFSVYVNKEKSVDDEQVEYISYSDGSGRYFPESNNIIQSERVMKLIPDHNLMQNYLNGIFIFYKSRIQHLVIIQEAGKQENVVTEPMNFRDIKTAFHVNNNVFFIDDEVKDLRGYSYSQSYKKIAFTDDDLLSYSPCNNSLVFTDNSSDNKNTVLVFYSFENKQIHVLNVDFEIKALLPVEDKLLVIGNECKTYKKTEDKQKNSSITMRKKKPMNKIKIIKIMVEGEGNNAKIKIEGKYKDNKMKYEFYEGLDKWYWLPSNNVFTEYQIFVEGFESVNSISLDEIERQ